MTFAEIPLTKGFVALVDEADLDLVRQYSWHAIERRDLVYARRAFRTSGRNIYQYMHRLIAGWNRVDHVNGNGLDNRRPNLRPCTPAQNSHNIRAIVGTSRFKGVSWDKRKCLWRVEIAGPEKKRLWLGHFRNEDAAACAYDEAARKNFGEFATFNFPRPGEQSALRNLEKGNKTI